MKINKINANGTTPIYNFSEEDIKLHMSKGNSKLGKGIYALSTLPGNEQHLLILNSGSLLTSIPGTCSHHCETCFDHGCYAVNSAKCYHNTVIPAWGANTLLLRAGKLFTEVEAFITAKNAKYLRTAKPKDIGVRMFRINVSGEIQNVEELEEWDRIAFNHPEVNFGLYTKNYEALDEFMIKHGDTQENFVINVSQWHGVADWFLAKYPNRFNVFEYDDSNLANNTLSEADKLRLASYRHCSAVTAEGKHAKNPDGSDRTCDQCLYCYRKANRTIAVYAH